MRDIDELFESLSRSRFRSRFRLSGTDARYLEQKGIDYILAVIEHWLRSQDVRPGTDQRGA